MKPGRAERAAPLPIAGKGPWGGLAGSVVVHGTMILLVILTLRKEEARLLATAATTPLRQVEMVYLPPQARPELLPQREMQAPDAVQSPDNVRSESTQRQDLAPAIQRSEPEAEPPEPQPVPPPQEENFASTPPPPQPEPTMESEAQRIFGRPELRRHQEATPQLGIRAGSASERDVLARTNCAPKHRDPHAPTEMAEIVGRVWYDQAQTRPLPGAFLQIIGTAYSAYSDRTGSYRLVFDASLVDECRTQFVRVVAAGYRGKNLVLGMGAGVNDVIMGR